MNTQALDRLAEVIVARLTMELEASGRHIHLCRADVETLFGPGARLERVRDLSQPGQFVCTQRVTLVGPKAELNNVVVLGPERPESQVEISLTDAVTLGVKPSIRISGDIADTPGIVIRANGREIRLSHGLIAAKRHLHMNTADAALWGVKSGQSVSLRCLTARPLTFEDVEVRVSDKFATAAHLDYDEANACGWKKSSRGAILP